MKGFCMAYQERDGVQSIRELARKMCILVNTFGGVIERNFPDNAEMQTALVWARTACTIVPLLDDVIADIPSSDPSPVDPALWPGINPDRHPAPELPDA